MRLLLPLCCFALLGVAAGAAPTENLSEAVVLTPHSGSTPEDAEIVRWQKRAGDASPRAEAFEQLGWAFVAKARRTLDAGYYKLAEKTADAMDERFGVSAESRLLRGHIYHNLHQFAQAEALARDLVASRASPLDLALLSDALMEEGRLDEAVAVLQRLVNLKPGAEAYSRIAHVRWLKGDLAGATAAMETAFRATSSRDTESYAWMLARLSGYYLQAGDASRALLTAESALKRAADFPPGLLARGRVLLALGRTAEAVTTLQSATGLNPLPEYQWWLADALRASARPDEAAKIEADLKRHGAMSDPRTFALFLATRGEEPGLAVRLAKEELTSRGDVFTHDAVAWALKAEGRLTEADAEMRAALAEHSQDARLLLHAGEIAQALGRTAEAQERFAQATPFAATLTPSERTLLERHTRSLVQAR